MKTSFSKTETPDSASEGVDAPDATELANLQGGGDVPAVERQTEAGEVDGDFEAADILTPYLTLVHGTSDTAKVFNLGDVIYNNEVRVCGEADKDGLTFVVFSLRKYYEQWIYPFDRDAQPETYNELDAVMDAGLTLDWGKDSSGNGIRPTARRVAVMTLLVEKPESCDSDCFFIEAAEGRMFAPAIWYARGTSYPAAKRIMTTCRTTLANEPSKAMSGLFRMRTTFKKMQSGSDGVVPQVTFVEKNPQELVDALQAAMS